VLDVVQCVGGETPVAPMVRVDSLTGNTDVITKVVICETSSISCCPYLYYLYAGA
jgi:hypothetical protein